MSITLMSGREIGIEKERNIYREIKMERREMERDKEKDRQGQRKRERE